MKIKCPGCASVLNIPDTAAGKVVKCPCGKQLRAPGAAAGPQQPSASRPAGSPAAGQQPPARPAAQRPTQQRPTPQRPTPQRPTAQRPAAAVGDFDPDMFDELTDADLQPVSAVARPGQARTGPATSAAGGKLLQAYASGDVRETGDTVAKGPRPGLLTFLGIANVIWALVYFGLALVLLGLLSILPNLDEEIPEAGGVVLAVIGLAMVAMGVLSVATTVACFVNKQICWYIMLFSYSYGFADRVLGAVDRVMNEEPAARIGGAVVGIVVGLSLWAYMHGDEVKAYYGTHNASIASVIVPNVLGLGIGGALAAAAVFMA